MAKRTKVPKGSKNNYQITEQGLHKALRYLGYTTQSQTTDIVNLVFFVLNNSSVTDEHIKQKAERLWQLDQED